MQGTRFGASKRQRLENIAAQRSARVQYDLPAPSLAACDLGESFRCLRNRAVGSGNQNDIGCQQGLREAGLRLAASDALPRDAPGSH
jgi:hypothetical protein